MPNVMLCYGNITENNMNQEIKRLLTVYENKMASLWQIEGQLLECEDDNRYFKLESKQRIFNQEVNKARSDLVEAILQLEQQVIDASWAKNPDRSGGQFKQEEITRQ